VWNGVVLEEESASVDTYTATLQIQGLATTGLDGSMVGHSRCLSAAAASLLARRLAEAKGWPVCQNMTRAQQKGARWGSLAPSCRHRSH
jgi:hypothetical protein